MYSGKAPLKGEARDRVRTSEGINPPSLGKTPNTHVLQTVNLGLLSRSLGSLVGKPWIIVKEPARGLSLLLCPCVLSGRRLFPQVHLLLLVTLVTIIFRILPKVTVEGRSHWTWSRRRLDSLGFFGGFTSLETVKVKEFVPVYSLSRLSG